jgi:integrase
MPIKVVRRHNSPHWYLRGTVRGISVDESTGVTDRKAAETIRANREWEILQASVFGRKAVATFLEATVSYVESGGERRFVKRLLDHFGTTPLAKVDQAALDRAARLLYPASKPATINRQVYTPASAILKHAATRGLCDHWQVDRPAQSPGRVRWITPEEADRLIAAASPHLRVLVIFLLYTGARLSEALYIEWQNVDLGRSEVQFVDTKNGEARGVPLHPRVAIALSRLGHREGAVFRRPDGLPYSARGNGGGQIKTGFDGACRRARIADFSPHDCRHTWATWHYAANRDLISLMKLGGWKSERMVLRYAHVNVEQLAGSIGALPWRDAPRNPLATTSPSKS